MKCSTIKLDNGAVAIVCGPRRVHKCFCGRVATLLCDYEIKPGDTCDAYICRHCATSLDRGRHLCQEHASLHEQQGALEL